MVHGDRRRLLLRLSLPSSFSPLTGERPEPSRRPHDQQHSEDANHDAWNKSGGVEVLAEKLDLKTAVLVERLKYLTGIIHHNHPAGAMCQLLRSFLVAPL
jgi:hypothetical protein